MSKIVPVIKTLTILVVIFFLLLTSIRILFTPLFLRVEYSMPGFPQDVYGFSNQERYDWAKISMAYLLNNEGIEFLEREKLSSGEPLYNERELQHMVDVKNLVGKALTGWYISIALLVVLGLTAAASHIEPDFWEAFSRGGLATLLLIVLIIFGVLTSFEGLFTAFHHLFFVGDTWLFRYSDTLIRLFPMRFWQDAFIFVGILSAMGGIIVFVAGRAIRNKPLKTEIRPKRK